MIRAAAGFVFALLLLTAARSQEQAARSDGQKVFQLAPGVYFWQGDTTIRRPANCTWILFKDYVVVIDANFPWGAREILPEIRRTTNLPIRFVFNTHYHADHTFGSALFKQAGATIVCSRACGVESRTKGEADWRNQVLNRARNPNASEHDKAVAAETIEKGYRLEHPTLLFDERMAFDDGERRLELIAWVLPIPSATPSLTCPKKRSWSPATSASTGPAATMSATKTPTTPTGYVRSTRSPSGR